MKTITFYSRENCDLCDDALEAVLRVKKAAPFELVVVDLDREASSEKKNAYDWDVPVLEIDGRKMMKHRVDEERLLRLLEAASSSLPNE